MKNFYTFINAKLTHSFSIITFLFTLFIYSPHTQAQTLVNQLFQIEFNYPDTVTWSASVLSGGNIITTGNTFNSYAQKTNIVTTKTDQGGSVVWQTEYNGTESEFDYGAAVAVDGSGNVFVTGASHASDDYTFDVVVIKYNSSGVQQWATTFNGTGSGNDIPSDILLIGSDIYVCAASIGTTTNYDYLLLKLNSSGVVQWNKRYDYASLFDIPGHLATNGSEVVVSGASQSSTTNWDYTSLKYNSSGTLLNTKRTTATGYGFDYPTGLVVDVNDNFYITGYTFNGTNYDMRTIKLDDDLSTVWTKTENGGQEDGSNAICIDGNNNIYIGGFSESSAGNKLMKIIKYDSSGTKLWTKTLQNSSNDIDGEVSGITFNSTSNKVVATGFYQYPSGKKVITTFALNSNNGNLSWKKDYPNLSASIDVPTNVLTNNNFIWVYGRRTQDDTTRYVTIKYETYEREHEIIEDTINNYSYLDNQLLISFNPAIVDLDFVNNKQQVYDNLQDVIADSVYDIIYPIIKGQGQFTSKAIKVYKKLTANDSLSITRLGDTISIPKFWSTFVVLTNVDPLSVIDTLNSISNIQYAELNNVYPLSLFPNDLAFAQESIFDGAASMQDVNAEPAWDVETGNPRVKVGVFDSGIFWGHEDYGDGTFGGSKIVGGWDYDNNYEVFNDNNDAGFSSSHATSVSGILGAISNNDIGIAGIAGGSFDADDPNSTGVQLFDFEIGIDFDEDEGSESINAEYAAEGILEGASYTPDGSYGYGLHIMNHSWGGENGGGDMITVGENIKFAFYNHVINVCAKGNDGVDDMHYPSDLRDLHILSVGGSAFDGEHEEEANFGNGIDLIAPYGNIPDVWTLDNDSEDDYHFFAGTSGSSPHVAGTAALMLSQNNNADAAPHFENLTHEDVENLLQLTADDRGDTFYDDETGWGLLDAGEALALVDRPQFKVEHFCSTYDEDDIILDDEDIPGLLLAEGFTGVSAGLYWADRYRINEVSNHTLTATTEILNSWVLPSLSNVLDAFSPVVNQPNFVLGIPTLTSVDVTGYIYFIKQQYPSGSLINKWIPFDPYATDSKFCYSLHTFDEDAVDEIDEVIIENLALSLYPNPVADVTHLQITSEFECEVTYSIANISGQKTNSEVTLNLLSGVNAYDISFSNLPKGVYILSVFNNSFNHSFRVIKI
ncbi:MAG: S8 family serine peptidase [Chitinophagales bacterium]